MDAAVSFEAEIQEEFAKVQGSLLDFVAALPGEVTRPADLQKILGIHYKICWQLFQVSHGTDVFAGAKSIPTPAAMRRAFEAGERLGVEAGILDRARVAVERFQTVIAKHSDDRNEFDAMTAAAAKDEAGAAADLSHRKAAYRNMSHLWGTRVDLACGTVMVRLSTSGNGTDECGVIMKRGLRRLRPNVSAVVQWQYHHTGSGAASPVRLSALDPAAEERFKIPLLPEFSSKPMPTIRAVPRGPGATQYEFADHGVGRSSVIDFTTGRVAREVPFSRDENGRRIYRFSFNCTTPTGALVQNLLVHRPSFGAVAPELMMFQSTPGDESPEIARGASQLAVWEKIEPLGSAWRVPPIAEVPKYRELVRYAAETLGWDLGDFDLFRVRIPFPVYASTCRMQFYID